MAGKLEGKVALISGAGRGQGLAEARLFGAEGAYVALGDVHYDDRASLEHEFARNGLVFDLDVADAGQWQAIVDATRQRFGGIDILINNAGVVAPSVTIIDLDIDDYMRVIRVNQIGPLLGIKYVAPSIIERGGGAIVNISSVAGLGAIPGAAPYVSSKFATRGLTKVAAIELGPRNIRVNSIHPGGVDTPMLRGSESAKRIKYEPKNLPLGRIAQPEEVARLALFLACDDSSYCTGSEFVIDGGQMCALGTP
jgi:3alpha(or 20beta)-hydroxysteroid dehydrogenase